MTLLSKEFDKVFIGNKHKGFFLLESEKRNKKWRTNL